MKKHGGVLSRSFNKILLIGILIWCVSASFSYYVVSLAPLKKQMPEGEAGLFGSLFDEVMPWGPGISAKAAIVVDAQTGRAIYSKNKDLQLPIASLTKLATALVFLNTNPDLNRVISITRHDLAEAGQSRLAAGDSITLNDCLHYCLICSDNAAALALARSTGPDIVSFVANMNRLAAELDMTDTYFADPTGRNPANVSTAADLVRLIEKAYSNRTIAEISSKKKYLAKPVNSHSQRYLYNTNRLLYNQRWKITGGKTGHIKRAGYCLALDVCDDNGRRYSAILLGSPSNKYRYSDANRLLAYALKQ
jgi:D-alanyl-D-alanine endopeptidase (penicillin-binding protein 7)